eukprot:INCI16329.12.p1 GENE.INCI16329.12~~INCI16329.12.p1  ORF type:complete len:301 (-),score=33.12 INCI16329.12:168-1070(-)
MNTQSIMLLHQMKTGGTSISKLLHCACHALRSSAACKMYSLSECTEGSIERCFDNDECQGRVQNATVMSYCTSLYDVDRFGWGSSRLFSVLRHPVDRIWSLYRFESRKIGGNGPPCFNCAPLADVYEMLDNGTLDELPGTSDVCKRSLSNYMTQFYSGNQLRGAGLPYDTRALPVTKQKELMLTSFFNMWNRSSLVLHTEDLDDGGFRMLQALAPDLFGRSGSGHGAGDGSGGGRGGAPCLLEHDNASPDLDACGRELASTPDERTRQLILDHNELDVLLYKSSLRMYDLQETILLGKQP